MPKIKRFVPPRDSEYKRFTDLLNRLPVGFYRTTPDGRMLDANLSLAKMLGYTVDELKRRQVSDLYFDKSQRPRFLEAYDKNSVEYAEFKLKCRDGGFVWGRDYSLPVKGARGRVEYYDGILLDISRVKTAEDRLKKAYARLRATNLERKQMIKKLESLSITDELTGLFNRRGFHMFAQQYLSIAARKKGPTFLLFIDLDNLKRINDVFGHHVGDQALIRIAPASSRRASGTPTSRAGWAATSSPSSPSTRPRRGSISSSTRFQKNLDDRQREPGRRLQALGQHRGRGLRSRASLDRGRAPDPGRFDDVRGKKKEGDPMKKRPVLILGCVCALAAAGAAAPIKNAHAPHIAKGMIAFSYHGDIWVAKDDGTAVRRLTDNVANETNPRFSPDGKLVAFTSDRAGNNDVYVVPVEGGEPVQMTFLTAGDDVQSLDARRAEDPLHHEPRGPTPGAARSTPSRPRAVRRPALEMPPATAGIDLARRADDRLQPQRRALRPEALQGQQLGGHLRRGPHDEAHLPAHRHRPRPVQGIPPGPRPRCGARTG